MKSIYGKIASSSLMIAGLACISACGSSTSTSGAGSCTFNTGGLTTCYDYTGSAYTTTTAQSLCTSTTVSGTTGGSYSTAACSSSGRVGSCTVNSGQTSAYILRYLSGFGTQTAQSSCTLLSGSFTAN